VTIDEALFSLQVTNWVRRAYYATNAEKNSRNLMLSREDDFFKHFIDVGAMLGRGVPQHIKVPKKVKLSAKYYVDRVLKPLLELNFPKW